MGTLFAALLSPAILTTLVNVFLNHGESAFKDYLSQKLSREQLIEQLKVAFLQAIAEVERVHADALTKTYATFMQAAVASPLIRYVWAVVVLSQTAVLVAVQTSMLIPPSEEFVQWAYVLVGALLGLGPLALRNGPGVLPMQSMRSATSGVR